MSKQAKQAPKEKPQTVKLTVTASDCCTPEEQEACCGSSGGGCCC